MITTDELPVTPDLGTLRRNRLERLRAQMAIDGLDVLLLLDQANVAYATGAGRLGADGGRAAHEDVVAVVHAEEEMPHIFTAFPDAVPADVDPAHVHPPAHLELAEGVGSFVPSFVETLGGGAPAVVAVDECSAALFSALEAWAGRDRLRAARPTVAAARVVKTPEEVACIERAQRINELAGADVRGTVRAGVSSADLTRLLLTRSFELGATGLGFDPLWPVMPRSPDDTVRSVKGDLVFPMAATSEPLRDGDVIWVDTAIAVHGYLSDYGRTWAVGPDDATRGDLGACFDRWTGIVRRVLDAVRPGATGADLTAAGALDEPRTPWLSHYYLIHGVGLDSAELPLIGSDLGPEFDRSTVLEPGMVLVLEPIVWIEERGVGYRAEEIVVVTESGYRRLSTAPSESFIAPR